MFYALTIFLGAFLLFQVQPLIGKYILPWFGGGPGVWTTCMLFFQVLLLAGYAYAHLISRKFRPRAQAVVHLVLLVAALALLPIVPTDSWKPRGTENPTLHILLLLAVSLGLPYLVLSATGPLIQQWFARANPESSPYRLYALSNLGSLLALVSYPFYFETHFTRKAQASFWAWGLAAYSVSCVFCIKKLWNAAAAANSARDLPRPIDAIPRAATGIQNPSGDWTNRPSAAGHPMLDRLLWFLLPASASILLLATTNKICQDVAVIPFLWVLPLAIYLLSFIICFDSPQWYVRFPFTLLLLAALAGVCWALFKGSDASIYRQVAIYSAGLFICSMVCHGEVYRLRPEPGHLTSFYLMIAAGGAFGGIFVAGIAPLIFTNYYELHCGLCLSALLILIIWAREPGAYWRRSLNRGTAPAPGPLPFFHGRVLMVVVLGIAFLALGMTLRLQIRDTDSEKVHMSRNFYGVLTVFEHRRTEPNEHHFLLQHGRITHGLQFVDAEESAWPTTYYGEESGVGLAMRALPPQNRRIGLVGLGTGTLAAYGKAGDYLRIYEINPDVKQLASSRFSYLTHSPAKIEVALGDARLSMERESPQRFDLLVLDAFSSDAIPVHLLTKEAFQIYQRHLNTNAIVAVHISNHYLDLQPVVAGLARTFDYKLAMIDYDETDEEWWLYSSTWILLSHDLRTLNAPGIQNVAIPLKSRTSSGPLWTDDFTSLFQVLK